MKIRGLWLRFGLFAVFLWGGGNAFAADINIDTTSPFVYPAYSKKISMNFQDASLVDVLKIFSEQSNLNLVTSEGIASKKVTVYLDNVPVEQALEQILRANGLTYELQPDSDIYIVKPISQLTNQLITRVYPLKHASVSNSKIRSTLSIVASTGSSSSSSGAATLLPAGITEALKTVLTAEGKVVEDSRTNSLIVTDIPVNFTNIELAISRLDVPIAQILIEVEMLEITKETSDKIGIKYGDTPLDFTGAQRDHTYPWDQNQLLAKGYTFEDPEYRVGTIDASGLAATLQFLRTQTDTKNLARPKILTLDNETAQIKITTQEAIGVKVQTTSTSSSSSNSSIEAERAETGVSLTVTPQINTATQEIIMAIIPEVIIARTGSTFNNVTFRDPERRGTQSILRVKSGETIIIGGLMRDDTSKVTTKLPFLGDLPFVGGAFRHKDNSIKERELVIFITPHIVQEKETTAGNNAEMNSHNLVREQETPVQPSETYQQ